MTQYLIVFNDEWVQEMTMDELQEAGRASRALIADMEEKGVFVFTNGGMDASSVVGSVESKDGVASFTDGPYAETKEHLGGLCIVDVADDDEARYWAGRIAVEVGWPQEILRFPNRRVSTEAS